MPAEYITDVVDPVELTGYVRDWADTDGQLPFASLLPPTQVEDIEYELTRVDQFVGEVARYRTWDTIGRIGKRPGVVTIAGEIPPLDWSYRLNERDIIKFQRVRAEINSQFGREIEDRIFNDARNAANAVQNRITLAHGEVLTTGKVTLEEIGDVVTGNELVADFGVPVAQMGIAPAIPWSTHATAVPVANLLAWEAIFRGNNGGLNPEMWLLSSTAMGHLALNAQIMSLAGGTSGVTPGVITAETVSQVLRAAGVQAPLAVSDVERPLMDASANARVIGEEFVLGMRPTVLGSTLYGISANAATLAGNGTMELSDAPGLIAFQTQEVRPPQILTSCEGIALPVLRDPNALFVADVL
jgi:hypothetical protein